MFLHTLEELLLQLSLCDLNLDGLVDLLLVSSLVVGVVLDCGGEEGVDEGGLSQAGLASNLSRWQVSKYSGRSAQRNRTMMVKAAPLFATILWRSVQEVSQGGRPTCQSI